MIESINKEIAAYVSSSLRVLIPTAMVIVAACAGVWLLHLSVALIPDSPIPPISQVQALSELVTQRVHLSDTLTGENNHWKVQWLLHGEAILGVDLSQATYANIDEANRTATISLPTAHVVACKVDHHRSAKIKEERKTLIPLPGLQSLHDEAWSHADEKVARLATHEGYLISTQLHAELVLAELFGDLGWDVSFEWKSAASARDDQS